MSDLLQGHSTELLFLLVGCAVAVGAYSYWHARRFWEGLPPILDAFVSIGGFGAFLAAFIWGGRLGNDVGHPNAVRVVALAITFILYRAIRTWIGKEQVRYRSARARRNPPSE